MNTKEAVAFIKNLDHWWYHGRRAVAEKLISVYFPSRCLSVLEIGAGFGSMTDLLAKISDNVDVAEPMEECRETLEKISSIRHCYHLLDNIPEISKYDGIFMFDVLEHIEYDQNYLKTLSSVYLRDNGKLFISVPAYQWLWSSHDEAHAHFRRYSRRELLQKLDS